MILCYQGELPGCGRSVIVNVDDDTKVMAVSTISKKLGGFRVDVEAFDISDISEVTMPCAENEEEEEHDN